MPAPQLSDNWEQHLRDLKPNWDGEHGEVISDSAIATLRRFYVIPCNDGGVNLLSNRDGFNIKIEISATGNISAAFMAKE